MNKTELTTLELFRDNFEFSAGHFTIFSAVRREKMHGHNFNVYALITAEIKENGMAFDYAIYKIKILELCKKLNGYFLLPTESPYLKVETQADSYIAHFNQEKLIFPKLDVILLPVRNITIEELATWFLEQLTTDQPAIAEHYIQAITIKVSSSVGQCASADWKKL